MNKTLRSIRVVNDRKERTVIPEDGDVGYVVIQGMFLNKTTEGKLPELSFLPLQKELTGIVIAVSDLNKTNCAVDLYKPVDLKK